MTYYYTRTLKYVDSLDDSYRQELPQLNKSNAEHYRHS